MGINRGSLANITYVHHAGDSLSVINGFLPLSVELLNDLNFLMVSASATSALPSCNMLLHNGSFCKLGQHDSNIHVFIHLLRAISSSTLLLVTVNPYSDYQI